MDFAAAYLRKEKLEAERGELVLEFSRSSMIGKSAAQANILDTIKAASPYDSAVLIQGETGTGKELVARAIHFNSPRKTEPFIVINCAAIPEFLVESELFGHEKGAFTGAVQQKKGKFELADKGTIFLDEVGDMPLAAQAKMLRVLQDHEITRVGGAKAIRTDVRIIAATNRNLPDLVAAGKFREDLYYRLKVIDIKTPALRDRKEDVPPLVAHFLYRHNHAYKQDKQLSPQAMRLLVDYSWPGNVRELENAIERAFVLSRGPVIHWRDLPPELSLPAHEQTAASTPEHAVARASAHLSADAGAAERSPDVPLTKGIVIPPGGLDLAAALESTEKAYMEEAIRQKDGNREAAARLLGIKPHTFRKRAKERFGL
jgi:transcriptional regulator with GAF, ATPase, and Fis domain